MSVKTTKNILKKSGLLQSTDFISSAWDLKVLEFEELVLTYMNKAAIYNRLSFLIKKNKYFKIFVHFEKWVM